MTLYIEKHPLTPWLYLTTLQYTEYSTEVHESLTTTSTGDVHSILSYLEVCCTVVNYCLKAVQKLS